MEVLGDLQSMCLRHDLPFFFWAFVFLCFVLLLSLFLVGFISSLPQLAWDKRLSCCCCCCISSGKIDKRCFLTRCRGCIIGILDNSVEIHIEQLKPQYFKLDNITVCTIHTKSFAGSDYSYYQMLYLFCRPEALGLVVGIVYLVTAIIFQQFHFTEDSVVCCEQLYFRHSQTILDALKHVSQLLLLFLFAVAC
jgi:hypothetical protein